MRKEIKDKPDLAFALSEGLPNDGILELDLLAEQLDDEDVSALADALKTNTSLELLSVFDNKIHDVSALVEALKTNASRKSWF